MESLQKAIGFLTFWITISAVYSQDSATCQEATTSCSACIKAGPNCAWCGDVDYLLVRCDLFTKLQEHNCSDNSNPTSTLTILQDKELTDGEGENADTAVQVQPQEVLLRLRSGDSQTIRLKVRLAKDYPVDLYYVMDLSHSMKNDLNALKKLGSKLASEMKNITRKIRLGFGSFVDKPVLPYISILAADITNPCGTKDECVAAYSFKNIHPLDNNSAEFERKINATLISGNIDSAEGGFDALMQLSVCGEKIGWRDKGRRLVIYTSDDSFHIQGDGKLAGIVKPFDGECHLDVNNTYTDAIYFDYPSIGHLNQVMIDNHIITIFAVTENQTELYQNLTSHIQGSTVGTLADDSGNVVELIKQKYEEITGTVKIVTLSTPTYSFSFSANCTNGTKSSETECADLKLGQEIYFDVTVTAASCSGSRNETFEIRPVGFEEKLIIKTELICECECSSKPIKDMVACSGGNGSLVCGKCACNSGRYGDTCQCDGTGNNEVSEDGCRENNSTIVCNGRGECICGNCVCNKKENPSEVISGKYCECDNFLCEKSENQLCGGADHGQCVCHRGFGGSQCDCTDEYEGNACDCPKSEDLCKAGNGLICNNEGACKCGKCTCNEGYEGKKCDKCDTCSNCSLYKECVLSSVPEIIYSGSLTTDQCSIEINSTTKIDPMKKSCDVRINETCLLQYTYKEIDDGVQILYVLTCATDKGILNAQNIPFLILAMVVAIVFIGLALILIFRLYTFVMDKKEYTQFCKEQQNALWNKDENPIYKQTTTSFHNPMFGK